MRGGARPGAGRPAKLARPWRRVSLILGARLSGMIDLVMEDEAISRSMAIRCLCMEALKAREQQAQRRAI